MCVKYSPLETAVPPSTVPPPIAEMSDSFIDASMTTGEITRLRFQQSQRNIRLGADA